MPIPPNIDRDHIIQAISKINTEGIPPRRRERKWGIRYEGNVYPCKLLISWGNIYANGEELNPDPGNFTTYKAQAHLSTLGFTIVPIENKR